MTPAEIEDWRLQFDSSYAALYFPWVQATDPLELTGLLRAVPPSGHVSGIYARCDLTIGVQKPPANELVEGAKDLTYAVDDSDHGDLNDVGIDAIRALSGRGIRVAGARTLSSDSLLLYINVRRLLIMIEQSFLSYAQWTVFEPNNPDLWREITRAGRAFLDGLWKQGFLDGASANEAYSVVCDATTNPPGQTDAGMVVCEIGVLPPWPAEFVIVRIGVTVDKTEILETTGVSHG
jgi:phage tail sheath protein FI